MRTLALALTVLSLAACGAEGAGPKAAAGPCANVQPILDARLEETPFLSLRGKNKMLGDNPLPDTFLGKHDAFGGKCEAGVMSGFFGASTTIYTYGCTLFEAGTMDREADGELAEKKFKEAQDEMTACLGEGWTSTETTENADYDFYRKIKWAPEFAEASASGFTVDPVYLEMSFTPFMRGRGGASGWTVQYQAQAQVDEEAAE